MKTIKYIYALAFITILFNACSAGWLEQQPQGSTITEEQFRQKEDKLHGSLYGAYAMMYQYGGDHDVFGVRSIDMYGDFNCGDMAMPTIYYGWFQYDEMGQTYLRRSYLWAFYYDIIRQCNKGIVYAQENIDVSFVKETAHLTDTIQAHKEYIEENYTIFNYYAQLLAMRGWCYSNLQKYFVATPEETDWKTTLSVPVYTEVDVLNDTTLGHPRETADSIYRFMTHDLDAAIQLFDITEAAGYSRAMKQEVNADVARLILAYTYLNAGKSDSDTEWELAAQYALEFIEKTKATILPHDKVLTTGFADINIDNWIWGQDVTIQTSTSLASFFGQVDIFTYSYAWAGDVKGIDAELYRQTTLTKRKWDIRSKWWNNMSKFGIEYAPDGKFYSPSTVNYKNSPKAENLDRFWLCDQVFMRAELGYLIAAEALWRLGETEDAISNLTAITDQRIIEGKETAYNTWKNSLSNSTTLGNEINYNWRIELWGEGYGMQTFRRFGKTVTLGANHKTRYNKEIKPTEPRKFTFEIPTSETYYNPSLRSTTELSVK